MNPLFLIYSVTDLSFQKFYCKIHMMHIQSVQLRISLYVEILLCHKFGIYSLRTDSCAFLNHSFINLYVKLNIHNYFKRL